MARYTIRATDDDSYGNHTDYHNKVTIVVTANNEEKAIIRAKKLVTRKYYQVIDVVDKG